HGLAAVRHARYRYLRALIQHAIRTVAPILGAPASLLSQNTPRPTQSRASFRTRTPSPWPRTADEEAYWPCQRRQSIDRRLPTPLGVRLASPGQPPDRRQGHLLVFRTGGAPASPDSLLDAAHHPPFGR